MRQTTTESRSWQATAVALSCALGWAAAGMTLSAGEPAAPSSEQAPLQGADHWAYQPLKRTEVVKTSAWARSPIDEFVLAGLRRKGLEPTEDASRRDLIRRLHFQLVGLPPTPEQVQKFVADDSPDAVERVVDGLLATPQFGERWGRHWLDLARYADSNGLDENFLFREAWRYRNWVIEAVNADMPFDRFVLEQIAGDLLPFESIEQRDRQRIAAGFLVIGPKVLLGNDPARQRMEVADEQLDTIGKAFLAQTLGCARCHDHKFDPVPTADYYAMAGILTSTQVMETRHMLNEQRLMERLIGLGSGGEALDDAYEQYWRTLPKARESAARAREALNHLERAEHPALAELTQKHPEAFAESAGDAMQPVENRIQVQAEFARRLEAVVANPPAIPPRAMIPGDADEPGDEAIRIAGEFDKPGESVPRGFLQVVNPGHHRARIPEGQSGRIELARWLTDVECGAGALTARVTANRVWHHLIGRGIVRTVDNFGRTGEPPSHPELLDHLARRLIDSGWSIKALIHEIANSRTFGLGTGENVAAEEADPDNALLWRAHRRRLDPESLRDAMLSVAGILDMTPMGSTVDYLGDQATAVGGNENRRRTDFLCRSVYLPMIRNDLPEVFEAFDFADPHATTGARPRTIEPTQGLFLLNDASVMDAATAAAKRILDEIPTGDDPASAKEARLHRLFLLLYGVRPTSDDERDILAFIEDSTRSLAADGDANPEVGAWSLACHALFTTSRFQFLE